ncbi:MAG: DUF4350 domain-containing protein [Pseudonocardia sp.]|nr:DUF4350 domain-containing protein [Pseudonocardia sp.]
MTVPEQAPRTTLRRDPRQVWAAARGPLAIAAVIIVLGAVLAAFAPRSTRGALDPESASPRGSLALATLLRERGVQVDLARRSAELAGTGPDATIVVPFADTLSRIQLDAVAATGADLVLVQPNDGQLDVLAPGVSAVPLRADADWLPDCGLPAVRAAGQVTTGSRYYTSARGIVCYRASDGETRGGGLVQISSGGRTVTVLGSSQVLTNEALADDGNAALAMNLLGQHPRLVWFRAVQEGASVDQRRPIVELVPDGWLWATGMLAVAAVLAIGWRARRLGRVVTEPLPVAVRAAEAVEGRARLYRRARARGHAADVLRDATRARLAGLVGTAIRPALIAAVAARTGRQPGEVDELLYGPAPVDDHAMIELARALDACEATVRRS